MVLRTDASRKVRLIEPGALEEVALCAEGLRSGMHRHATIARVAKVALAMAASGMGTQIG